MIRMRFSFIQAFKDAWHVFYKHPIFFGMYFIVTALLSLLAVVALGCYLNFFDQTNIAACCQMIKVLLLNVNYVQSSFDGLTPYDSLKYIIPSDNLNYVLKTMNWKEYFNIVIYPKRYILIGLLCVWIFVKEAIFLGFIKISLLWQQGKSATLKELYKNFALIPSVLMVNIIGLSLAGLVVMTNLVGLYFLVYTCGSRDNVWIIRVVLLLGVILLLIECIAAIYVVIRCKFFRYFIVQDHSSAWASLCQSWQLTHGSVISLNVFALVRSISYYIKLPIITAFWAAVIDPQFDVSVYRQLRARQNKND
jgi:hypothetical protein